MCRNLFTLTVIFLLTGSVNTEGYEITHMIADLQRPYIYAIQQGQPGSEDSLLFIDVHSEDVTNSLAIGNNITDLAINYAEARLYLTNHGFPVTRVVDLDTQIELPPLELGVDVFSISAGRPGRIYYEEEPAWASIWIIDSDSGERIFEMQTRTGDGAVDPTGIYHYHLQNINTNAAFAKKYNVSTDTFSEIASVLIMHPGSRNMIMSADGSRLFCRGTCLDSELNELISFPDEIYATTLHGDLAFGSSDVYDTHTGDIVYTLPISSTVTAVSGDQEKLFLFNSETGEIEVIPISEIADIPGPGLNPVPPDGSGVILPLDRLSWSTSPFALYYQVYFGDDEDNVAEADTTSPEYLGTAEDNFMDLSESLDLGQTYYWRLDLVWFDGITHGDVWSFTVAPIIVEPNILSVTAMANTFPPEEYLVLISGETSEDWSVTEDIAWLELDRMSGMTPDTVTVSFDIIGLPVGTYHGTLYFSSDTYDFELPVNLVLTAMPIFKMITDYERPYIYAFYRGTEGESDALLLFINTDTELVERVLPIGINPTDMSINYAEGRLYITNLGYPLFTRIIDLETQEELPPLELGGVYKINAGRPGRIYCEEQSGWITIRIIDTETGEVLGSYLMFEGDGEVDPTGNYYYHVDHGITCPNIYKHDISTDGWILVHMVECAGGSRNLVMSGDGSRLFCTLGNMYDADLNRLGELGAEIYATTLHGDLAFGSSEVFDTHTGEIIYILPLTTTVMAVSEDQEKLFLFDGDTGEIEVVLISEIADIRGPGLNPNPPDEGTIVLPLEQLSWDINPFALYYQVYFGDDEDNVAEADTTSPEYLGTAEDNFMDLSESLDLGQTYYWRLDLVWFDGITHGDVWSFTAAPVIIEPNMLLKTVVVNAVLPSERLIITSGESSEDWGVVEDIAWLNLDHTSGVTPDTIIVNFDLVDIPVGRYIDYLYFSSGDFNFTVPVDLEIIEISLSKMVVDFDRPYIYALHPGDGGIDDAFLLFISTESERIEKIIPIGSNTTDMSINHQEARLYVNNWHRQFTHVVDMETQSEIGPLDLGWDVYLFNAGRAGRAIYEGGTYRTSGIIDTETGEILYAFEISLGDSEIDPLGPYYYHSDEGHSGAKVMKFDMSGDSLVWLTQGPMHPYGSSRNLVMSGDGSRLFWIGYIYDEDLNELGHLPAEIYSTTIHGELAIAGDRVFNSATLDSIYALPFESSVSAVSGDQEKLFLYDDESHDIVVIPMGEIWDPTRVSDEDDNLPKEFFLSQNYPNPFNPSTKINYALPEAAHVKLQVYNILGQCVITLIDEVQEPGYHSYNWNTGDIPTGVYFYRIKAGKFEKTKKMMPLK